MPENTPTIDNLSLSNYDSVENQQLRSERLQVEMDNKFATPEISPTANAFLTQVRTLSEAGIYSPGLGTFGSTFGTSDLARSFANQQDTRLSFSEYVTPATDVYERLNDGTYAPIYENILVGSNNEERLAREQGRGEVWSRGWKRFRNQVLTSGLGNLTGIPVGIAEWINTGNFEATYDNDYTRWLDDLDRKSQLRNNIYYTEADKNASLFGQMGTSRFWADKALGGAAFTVGMILSEGALALATGGISLGRLPITAGQGIARFASKMGVKQTGKTLGTGLTKSHQILGKIAAGEKVGLTAIQSGSRGRVLGQRIGQIANDVRFIATSSGYEAGMEARHFRKDAEEQFYDYYNRLGRQPTAEEVAEFRRELDNSSNMVFGANMGILGVSNVALFGRMFGVGNYFKGIMKPIDKEINKRIFGIGTKQVGKNTFEPIKRNTFQKVLSPTWHGIVKPVISEGFWEEGGQGVASTMMSEYIKSTYDPELTEGTLTYLEAFQKGLEETYGTKDGQTEVLIGAIIGVLFGSLSGTFTRGSREAKAQTGIAETETFVAEAPDQIVKALYTQENLLSQLGNANRAQHLEEGIERAEQNGELVEANLKTKALVVSALQAAESVGKPDSFLEVLKGTILGMEDSKIMEHFGISAEQVQEFKQDKVNAITRIAENHKKATRLADTYISDNSLRGEFKGKEQLIREGISFAMVMSAEAEQTGIDSIRTIKEIFEGLQDPANVDRMDVLGMITLAPAELKQEYDQTQQQIESTQEEIQRVIEELQGIQSQPSAERNLTKEQELQQKLQSLQSQASLQSSVLNGLRETIENKYFEKLGTEGLASLDSFTNLETTLEEQKKAVQALELTNPEEYLRLITAFDALDKSLQLTAEFSEIYKGLLDPKFRTKAVAGIFGKAINRGNSMNQVTLDTLKKIAGIEKETLAITSSPSTTSTLTSDPLNATGETIAPTEEVEVLSEEIQEEISQNEKERQQELAKEQSRLKDEAQKRQAKNIQAKIKKAKQEISKTRNDIASLQELQEFLEQFLSEVDGYTSENIEHLNKKLNYLNGLFGKRGYTKKSTNQRIQKTLQELREEKTFANELVTRLKETQEQIQQLEQIEKDLQKKVSYYNSLQQRGILSQEQVQEEIDNLNSKRDTITRLIDKLKDIIGVAKNILRDLVDIVFVRHNSLESFEAFTSYTRKTPEQLREEIRQGIADDNYASLTKNYEEIENGLIEAMDNVESQEQTISYREEQLQQLQDKVTDIDNNIRYLRELQEGLPQNEENRQEGTSQAGVTNKPTGNLQGVSAEQQKADIERRRQEELNSIKISPDTFVINENRPVSPDVITEPIQANRSILGALNNDFSEKRIKEYEDLIKKSQTSNKQKILILTELEKIKINAKYDAELDALNNQTASEQQTQTEETQSVGGSAFNDFIHQFFNRFYIEKVKTGELTVEQALQALEQEGQQNSFEYRQLQSEAVQAQQQVQETLTLQRLREIVGSISLIQKHFPTLPDDFAQAEITQEDIDTYKELQLKQQKGEELTKAELDTYENLRTKFLGFNVLQGTRFNGHTLLELISLYNQLENTVLQEEQNKTEFNEEEYVEIAIESENIPEAEGANTNPAITQIQEYAFGRFAEGGVYISHLQLSDLIQKALSKFPDAKVKINGEVVTENFEKFDAKGGTQVEIETSEGTFALNIQGKKGQRTGQPVQLKSKQAPEDLNTLFGIRALSIKGQKGDWYVLYEGEVPLRGTFVDINESGLVFDSVEARKVQAGDTVQLVYDPTDSYNKTLKGKEKVKQANIYVVKNGKIIGKLKSTKDDTLYEIRRKVVAEGTAEITVASILPPIPLLQVNSDGSKKLVPVQKSEVIAHGWMQDGTHNVDIPEGTSMRYVEAASKLHPTRKIPFVVQKDKVTGYPVAFPVELTSDSNPLAVQEFEDIINNTDLSPVQKAQSLNELLIRSNIEFPTYSFNELNVEDSEHIQTIRQVVEESSEPIDLDRFAENLDYNIYTIIDTQQQDAFTPPKLLLDFDSFNTDIDPENVPQTEVPVEDEVTPLHPDKTFFYPLLSENYHLNFENNIDESLIAVHKKVKNAQEHLEFLKQELGLEETEIRKLAKDTNNALISRIVKGPGRHQNVPTLYNQKPGKNTKKKTSVAKGERIPLKVLYRGREYSGIMFGSIIEVFTDEGRRRFSAQSREITYKSTGLSVRPETKAKANQAVAKKCKKKKKP